MHCVGLCCWWRCQGQANPPSTGMPMVSLLATRAMILLLTWRNASFLLKPCRNPQGQQSPDRVSAQHPAKQRQHVTNCAPSRRKRCTT